MAANIFDTEATRKGWSGLKALVPPGVWAIPPLRESSRWPLGPRDMIPALAMGMPPGGERTWSSLFRPAPRAPKARGRARRVRRFSFMGDRVGQAVGES